MKKETTNKVVFLAMTALFTAMVLVFTAFINIQIIPAKGGLVHLGNVPMFVGAILFGKKLGAICGGVGMALFDLLSGWTIYAPFTLVVVAMMGFVVGLVAEKKPKLPWYVLAFVFALTIKVVGYYIAEVILYGSFIVPLASIPGNCFQIITAVIITVPIIVPLRLAANKIFPKSVVLS